MKKKHQPLVRGFEIVNGLVFGALFVTGAIMAVTRTPSSSATFAANNGVSTQPGQPESLQELHEGVASLMILVAVVGGAWLMVRVHEDWSGRLAAAAAVGMVAVVSGMMVRYEAVQIDGVFDADLRGLGFVFNSGLDQVTFGGRSFGAGFYRLWVGLHVVSSVAMIVLTTLGVRDIRRVREPLVRVRPGNGGPVPVTGSNDAALDQRVERTGRAG